MAIITSIDVSPTSGNKPLEIAYEINVSAVGGYSVTIDFGDGNNSFTESGTHTYENAGNFTFAVAVEDSDEPFESDSGEVEIEVFETKMRQRGQFFGAF